MNKKAIALVMIVLFALITAACNTSKPAATDSGDKIQVVSTIFPLTDITRNIGGDKVDVVTLIPPGASPHTFEVTPEQVKQFAEAQVFIKVGAGLDDFADKLVESTNADLITITVTDAVNLFEGHDQNNCSHDPGNQSHSHHGNKDPHIWLDPVLVKEHITTLIAGKLSGISPENQQYFQQNLDQYCLELDQLHQETENVTAGLEHRTFIAFHSAWRYFAERYGLHDITVEEFPGKEPSAQWIARVIDTAREKEAMAVLAEPQFSIKGADAIAEELGNPVVLVDPLGDENKPGYDSYLNMMRSNIKVLEQALRGVDDVE